jgi:four helix bundle protein
MGDFRRLTAWQKARALVQLSYTKTAQFPKSELFGLTSQTRRAAVSVAANIAEGRGKNSDKELNRYLGIALGSATELECLSLLASDLKFLTEVDANALIKACQEVQAMIAVLRRSLG